MLHTGVYEQLINNALTRDQLLVALDFMKPNTVREFKTDHLTGGAEAYTFLGTAEYVRHEGSKPMNIT